MKELKAAPPPKQVSPVKAAQIQRDTQATHRRQECTQLHINHDTTRAITAIKIQAAFRGYLARKALKALKGVVKLQALIRGWAVRQQAINTLKCLQSIVNIQTEVQSKRGERTAAKDSLHCQEFKQHDLWEKDIRVDLNSQNRWDESTLTREELKSSFLTKREAMIKRERIKDYYLNHRRSAETERDRAYMRRRYWLEQWVDAQLAKSNSQRNLDRTHSANGRNREPNSWHSQRQCQAETPDSPMQIPRRSYHHRKQRSIGDESSFTMPAYMAATESAKARARSLSSPRLRPLSFDVCSEITSPYKHKLSPISSINSELTSSSWVGNHVSSLQKSPRLKNLPGPIKSTTSFKEVRIRGNRAMLANDASPMRK